jgi:hypothetical protein
MHRFAPRRLSRPCPLLTCLTLATATIAAAQSSISVGDMVAAPMNGQNIVGEVAQVHGALVDLNLGQNQLARFVSLENVRVLQPAGTGPPAHFAVGDTVQVPYLAGTVMSGRIMKVNGGYCEIDSSQSGFTGWSKCSELVGKRNAGAGADGGSGGRTAAPGAPTGKPPKPGFTRCAGTIEGRYGSSAGLPVSIVFRGGTATLTDPGGDGEQMECWISGKSLLLHDPQLGNADLPIDINDDGTLETPFGEIRKKGS